MKVTTKVAANEFGSATTRYLKDVKYDSEGAPWKTQLHVNLIAADLATEVLPATPDAIEEKAIEAAPENKAMAAPEDKSETVTVEVTGGGGGGSGGSGTYRGGRRGAVKGE